MHIIFGSIGQKTIIKGHMQVLGLRITYEHVGWEIWKLNPSNRAPDRKS
jgi:hypothetical protein